MTHVNSLLKKECKFYLYLKHLCIFFISFFLILASSVYFKNINSVAIEYHVLTSSEVTIEGNAITKYKGSNYKYIEIPAQIGGNNIYYLKSNAFTDHSEIVSVKAPYIKEIQDSGDGVFCDCLNLKSVYMPNLTYLGKFGFYGCKNLTSIVDQINSDGTIPEGQGLKLDKLITLGGGALTGNDETKSCPITSFSAKELTTIKDREGNNRGALERCKKLTKVYAPKLTSIGTEAFEWCTGLVDLTIGNVSTFNESTGGGGSFKDCTYVKNLTICGAKTISNSTSTLGKLCQKFRDSLENLKLTDAESIQGAPFYKFSNLRTVEAPQLLSIENRENLSGVGEKGGFEECSRLQTFKAPKLKDIGKNGGIIGTFYRDTSLSNVEIGSLESLGQYAFTDCNLQNLTVHAEKVGYNSQANTDFYSKFRNINCPNLKSIEGAVFQNSTSLTSFTAPKLESVGESSFSGCTQLKSLNFSNLTNIGKNAFNNCKNLTDIYVGNLSNVGTGAFDSCSSLKNLNVNSETLDYKESVTNNCFKKIPNIICKNLKKINGAVFKDCNILESINVPNLVSVGDSSFSGCEKLKSFSAPLLESAGDSAFNGCNLIKDLVFENLEVTGKSAFANCGNLDTFKAPKMMSISESAFENCARLDNVVTPRAVYIGNNAFAGCDELSKLSSPTDPKGNFTQGIVISRLAKNADFSTSHNSVPTSGTAIIPAYNGMGITRKDIVKSEGDDSSGSESVKLSDDEFNNFRKSIVIASVYCNGDDEVIETFKGEADEIKDQMKKTDKSLGNNFNFDYISKYYADYANNATGNDRYVVVKITEDGKPDKIRIISWTQNFQVSLTETEFDYNGGPQQPDSSNITITYGNNSQTLDKNDYELTPPENATDAGAKSLSIKVKSGNYGTVKVDPGNEPVYQIAYYIKQKTIDNSSNINVELGSDTNFDGEKWDIKLNVTDSDITDEERKNLKLGKDYTISQIVKKSDSTKVDNVVSAGDYKLTLNFIGNYTGTKTADISINKMSSDNLEVTPKDNYKFINKNINPEFNVINPDRQSEQILYTISQKPEQILNVGSYDITLTFDNYSDKDVTLTVNPVNSSELAINFNPRSKTYDATEWKPKFQVSYGEINLSENDYDVNWDSNMIDAGEKNIDFMFKGNYDGLKTETLIIEKASSERLSITKEDDDHIVGDDSWKPTFVIKDGNLTLKEGEDYTINLPDLTSPGEKNIEFEFKNYEGKRYESVNIKKIDVSNLNLKIKASESDHKYDGKVFSPTFTIQKEDETLNPETDYDVIFPDDMTNVGEKVVKFVFKGIYTGELKKVLFISGTRGGWGEIVINSGVVNYISDDGTTSAEIKSNEKTWLKEESGGTSAWYCLDNSNGTFELGSKFSVKWLKENENYAEYQKEWNKLDDSYKRNVDKNKSEIFSLTVTSPDGKLYTSLDKSVKCYVQIGEDWSKDDIRARFLSSSEDEIIEANFQKVDCPDGRKEFACLTLKHLSPYLVYEHSENVKSDENKNENSNENKDESNSSSDKSNSISSENSIYDKSPKSFNNPKTHATPENILKLSVFLLVSTIVLCLSFKLKLKNE